MISLLIQSSLQPTLTVLTHIFVNTTIFRFCAHMFIHLPNNGLNADTCQEEIKLQKLFCVCNTVHSVCLQSEGNSSLLCFQYNQKHNTVSLNTTVYLTHKISYIFQLIYSHHQADYKSKTVYTATCYWYPLFNKNQVA
jgi:hypothetical protein